MAAFLDQYWQMLALGLVLGVTVYCAWRFQKRIAEPLAGMLKSVERLSSGDWQTHVEVPQGQVGRALGTALERLRINLSDHAATGRALDIMLDSMNDAVFVTSPDGLIKRVNLAATQLLGWSQMELLGRELAFVIADQDRTTFNIEQATNEDDPDARHFWFGDAGGHAGTLVSFLEYPAMAEGSVGVGSTHHLALAVDSAEELDAWRDYLRGRGVQTTEVFERGRFRSLYLRDPDGHILELATRV